jgi:hypothetical protein
MIASSLATIALPDYARVWIYAADRAFTQQEEEIINSWLAEFITNWNSHGNNLTAAAEILEHQIILFAVDESKTPVSGCSIDKSVALLRKIEKHMNVNLLDGGRVCYKNQHQIVVLRLPQIKQAIEAQHIKTDTWILNIQANNLGDIKNNLFVPAAQSWMARYFR